MVLILDGHLEIGAHVRPISDLVSLIYLRHLIDRMQSHIGILSQKNQFSLMHAQHALSLI